MWTWTALDAHCELIISYKLGDRTGATAEPFMLDLADRVTGRITLTSVGHGVYPGAVDLAFGDNIDFAQLIKHYDGPREGDVRYSQPKCTSCTRKVVIGNPDPATISTFYVGRQNLTIHTNMKRMARLTLG